MVSLELARRIAAGLPRHPEWIELARANLRRWSEQNRNAPSLLRCYKEWQQLLLQPVTEIIRALTAETEDGQTLRQNSPFAGALPASEVWKIKSFFRHAASAA
jgi:hypothetical protein